MLPRSYTEARAAGETHYFTGRPCKFGHVARRIVRSRNCCECTRLTSLRRDRAEFRAANRKSFTGFSPELVQQRMEEQGGRCAICRNELQPGKRTHADHCHETGTCRGMLCRDCNWALGWMKDSPERMRAAADYIEHWRRK